MSLSPCYRMVCSTNDLNLCHGTQAPGLRRTWAAPRRNGVIHRIRWLWHHDGRPVGRCHNRVVGATAPRGAQRLACMPSIPSVVDGTPMGTVYPFRLLPKPRCSHSRITLSIYMQPASSGACPEDEALAVDTGEAGSWGSKGGLPICKFP